MSKVIVRLVETPPMTREEFFHHHRGADVDDIAAEYRQYLDRHQPYRWVALSAGNHEPLARSTETYFNERDCERAIELLFSAATAVELVRVEGGIEARRPLR